jgi:hypothetical protein
MRSAKDERELAVREEERGAPSGGTSGAVGVVIASVEYKEVGGLVALGELRGQQSLTLSQRARCRVARGRDGSEEFGGIRLRYVLLMRVCCGVVLPVVL